MKYELSLEDCGKRKRYYKVVQNEAKAQHEYLAYVTMCIMKSFEKFFFLYESYYVSKLYEIFGPITTLNKNLLIYEVV